MRIRSTILMCMLAAIGVVAAVLTERYVPRAGAHRAGEPVRLIEDGAVPVETVQRVRLERAGEPPRVYERGETGWNQVEPFRHPMDAHSMGQMIKAATEVLVLDEVDAGELSPQTLGLDPPRARLVLEWPEDSLALELGRTAIAGRAYLRRAGDEAIHVVDQALHVRAVTADEREWRDRTLFLGVGVDSDRIETQIADVEMVLERERKQWWMTAPVRTRANRAALDELFQALGRARASGFVEDQPEALGQFGLDPPTGTVTVTNTVLREQDGEVVRWPEAQRLRVGGRRGVGTQDRFGLIEGRETVVVVPAETLARLFVDPRALIASTATAVQPADVKTLRVRTADGELVLERELTEWIAPEHGGVNVPAATVQTLLEALSAYQAAQIRIMDYPRDLEVATIVLLGFDGRPLDTVRIVREKPEEGHRWGMENGDGVLRIHDADLELPLEPADFGLGSRS